MLPCAVSFLYKGAIDNTFNIASYSSLISGMHSSLANSTYDQENNNLNDGANDAVYQELVKLGFGRQIQVEMQKQQLQQQRQREQAVKALLVGQVDTSSKYSVGDPNASVSALIQNAWDSNNSYCAGQILQRQASVVTEFPHGTAPGTFMHEVLQDVTFERVKERGFHLYFEREILPERTTSAVFDRLIAKIKDTSNIHLRLADWFNEVLEAPIVMGKHHCLALADLVEGSYEREMGFLMANSRFDTTAVDEICKDVALDILPPNKQHLASNLVLQHNELVGFFTGSIDLACRFDLNRRLPLRLRPDLFAELPENKQQSLLNNIDKLKDAVANGKLAKFANDPELFSDLDFDEAVEALNAEQDEEPCYKYYVIDYKSNYLGDKPENYGRDQLLDSIYSHRYDVQFLIYSLALYRFLKRRMAVPFNASKEELRAFYDKHIGGVMYLYLRGMKANYLRNQISTGVFTTKIDFEYIDRLDAIFGRDEQ